MSPKNKKTNKILRRCITAFFFIVVPTLLFFLLKDLEWQEVKESLQGYSLTTLLGGVGIAALSYTVFSCYDLLGRHYTGHDLATERVLRVAFVCYAFNLNFGAWLGGIALRYRLYSQAGLALSTVTEILSISLLANWVGYMLLAGILFSFRVIELPADWAISAGALQLLGGALIALSLLYLWACGFSRRRSWRWRDYEIELPSLKLALMQVALGTLNWSLMAALIYTLLPEEAFYPIVLATLMVSSIAGVATHIPAGLGVLEAVFIALMRNDMATGALVAALIAYRAIYFLLPLTLALVIYFVMERRAKKS